MNEAYIAGDEPDDNRMMSEPPTSGARRRVDEQTEWRHAVLKNGYTPLANKEKSCLLPGWPKLDVTQSLIDEWRGDLAYQTTGIRIDPPLVAIDVDIDDRELVVELFNRCAKTFGKDWANGVLIRTGSGAKETWLCKCDEPFAVPPGLKYVRPDEDLDDEEVDRHKVELFGGGSKRQIGAFGVHTPGYRLQDEPKVSYTWEDDRSPATVPLSALPELTRAQCNEIGIMAAELLDEAGWQRDSAYRQENHGGHILYDLDPEGTFVTAGGETSLAGLASAPSCRMLEITGD